MTQSTYLITGALGCIGAWTTYHLVRQGERVVSLDLFDRGHRLNLLLTPEEQKAITFVKGDISDYAQVLDALRQNQVTHIVHLAALQVPFCKADPVKGAQVNVVGTVNLFEAARQSGVGHLTYASSIAIYGAPEDYPSAVIGSDAEPSPHTLYGVYKQADEGIARVYWQDWQVSSTALRPYTVYGVGRDQGLTSDPTKAMLAAAAGKPFHINFGGTTQLQWASDVAQQFIAAAQQPFGGAFSFNMGGEVVAISEIVNLIQTARPDANITYGENRLAFPESFDDSDLRQRFAQVYETTFAEGLRQTIAHFEACLRDGRLTPEMLRL